MQHKVKGRPVKRLRLLSVHEMLSLDANGRLADSSSATPVLKIVCPSLVRLDADLNFQPEVARSWTISPDHRVFTFKLHENARFHSGRALDADAVVRNFQRLFDTRVGSLLAKDYEGCESIRALARDSVEFRFAEPFPAFLHHLAGRTHIADDCHTQPVGGGAYRVTDWVRGEYLTMRRFEDYYEQGKPLADEIVVRWAPDGAQRLAQIEAGEADIVEAVPAKAADSLRARGILESASAATTRKLSLSFNCGAKPFDDPRVRLAAAYAVDRAKLVETFFGNYARVFDTAYPAGSLWSVELEPIVHDLDKARALMREAGYADGVDVQTIATNVAPVPAVARAVAQDLARIGIRLDIRGYDDPPWWPLIYLDTQWQAAFQGMGPRAHPDILFRREYASGGTFNPVGYSNAELDGLIRRARATIEIDAQAELYRQAQRILRRDLPYLPLYVNTSPAGWRPEINGFRPHPLGYWDVTEVYDRAWK